MLQQRRFTLPELIRELGISRSTGERLVAQYAGRLGGVERYGLVRSWPCEALEALRVVHAEEIRLKEVRR